MANKPLAVGLQTIPIPQELNPPGNLSDPEVDPAETSTSPLAGYIRRKPEELMYATIKLILIRSFDGFYDTPRPNLPPRRQTSSRKSSQYRLRQCSNGWVSVKREWNRGRCQVMLHVPSKISKAQMNYGKTGDDQLCL